MIECLSDLVCITKSTSRLTAFFKILTMVLLLAGVVATVVAITWPEELEKPTPLVPPKVGVLVTGGYWIDWDYTDDDYDFYEDDYVFLDSVELWDIQSDHTCRLPGLNVPRSGHSQVDFKEYFAF